MDSQIAEQIHVDNGFTWAHKQNFMVSHQNCYLWWCELNPVDLQSSNPEICHIWRIRAQKKCCGWERDKEKDEQRGGFVPSFWECNSKMEMGLIFMHVDEDTAGCQMHMARFMSFKLVKLLSSCKSLNLLGLKALRMIMVKNIFLVSSIKMAPF